MACRFVEVWRASKILAPEVLDGYISHTVLHKDRPAFFRYSETVACLYKAVCSLQHTVTLPQAAGHLRQLLCIYEGGEGEAVWNDTQGRQ